MEHMIGANNYEEVRNILAEERKFATIALSPEDY
jgi:hypothetical protein